MSTDLRAALRTHFGFDTFRPGQEAVLSHLLAGRSAAAVFPTGGGKSICYQLPALLLPGVTLVVSPLIALMKDQIDALAARGIAAARLDSTLDADGYRAVMDQIRAGTVRLLYVAPERFNNERFRETLERLSISLFAVDEAHCISEWGHNFRPDYLKLAKYAKQCRAERVLALTATATEKVLGDVCRAFEIAPECAVRTGFYRPNLTVLTTPAATANRDALLIERIRERPAGPTIVYVTLQKTAEQLAATLAKQGFLAKHYHAGMDDEIRAGTQDWFIASDRAIVVATIAFGMGIDKANVRYVYHYNAPKSLENYSQEIGRAGRDGETSICETLLCPDDLNVLENFIYGDTPTRGAIRGLVSEVFAAGDTFDASVYELSGQHDIRPLVARTLLTYLELLGYFEGGTPFYSTYQFKPLATSAQILAKFTGPRRDFLANVFRQATKAKTWFHIDVDRAALTLHEQRERIIRALDYLGEQQLIELKVAGVRLRFRRLKSPDNEATLTDTLFRRAAEHEKREIARLQQVLDLATLDGCQVASLAAHFGETLAQSCGHCSWCKNGGKSLELPKRQVSQLDDATWRRVSAARVEKPEFRTALSEPRALARFLCGVGSPRITKAKLSSHPLFGVWSQVPFQEVLAKVEKVESSVSIR